MFESFFIKSLNHIFFNYVQNLTNEFTLFKKLVNALKFQFY